MLRRSFRLLTVICSVAGMAACAPTKQITDVKPAGGFLPSPELLQAGKSGQAALTFTSPGANWSSYTKVILEPVTLWTGANSDLTSIPPERRQALANALYGELHNAISQRCQMVTEPSPGTMTMRFALVEAEASNPALNTISTYVPQARILSTLGGYAFNSGAGVFTGSATAEGYGTDATTGALLWQAVDKQAGNNAIGSDTFNSWADVDNAFKAWAELMKTRMAALGICP